MARIKKIVDPMDLDKKDLSIFNEILSTRKGISGPFSVLLHSPEIAGRIAHLGAYIRFESRLPNDLRELAIIVSAKEMECLYEWEYHLPLALKAGVPEELVALIDNNEDIKSPCDNYSLIITFCRELTRFKKVTSETFDKVIIRFGKKVVTELTSTVGYYLMLACILNTFEVTPDEMVN